MTLTKKQCDGLFSTRAFDYETPQYIFDELNKEFHFTLDPCASHKTAKCLKYYTKGDDGLSQSWDGEIVFCNPPYGREIKKWVKKASQIKNGVVVMLIPARTDTEYFHQYIYQKAELRFIKGRLYFTKQSKNVGPAPFPLMIVIFRGKQ